MLKLPNKKYRIILADPPWKYTDKRVNPSSDRPKKYGGIEYPVMDIDELCKIPINNLANIDSVLFLWTTMPLLKKSFKVMEAWGFKYRTCAFVWVKTTKNGIRSGLGRYTNSNAELCLLGLNGNYIQRKDRNVKQIVLTPLQKHSKKPDEVRERIVNLYGDLPRIELFARDKKQGWDTWGDELPTECQNILPEMSTEDTQSFNSVRNHIQKEKIILAIQTIKKNSELTYGYREDVVAVLNWVLTGEPFDGLEVVQNVKN